MIKDNDIVLNALVDYINWVYYNDFYLNRREMNRYSVYDNLNATRLANTVFIINYNFLKSFDKPLVESTFNITPYGIIPRDIYFINLKLGSYNYNNRNGKRIKKHSLDIYKLLDKDEVKYIYAILVHLRDIELFSLIKEILQSVDTSLVNSIKTVEINTTDIKDLSIDNLTVKHKKQTN